MRRAAKFFALFVAFSVFLTVTAYADTGPDIPGGETAVSPADNTSAPASPDVSAPDPEPPVAEDGQPAEAVTDAASLPASGYTTLTGRPGRDLAQPITIGTEAADTRSIALDETVAGDSYTSVYALGGDADVTVAGSVSLSDDSAGENVCFPSGRGAALVAHDNARMALEDASIATEGLSRAALMVSDGADVTVSDSTLAVAGGRVPSDGEGYVNTPDAARMIAPPWGLGISGGSRAIGLVGLAPGLSLLRTDVTAAGWGVLSASESESADVTAVDSALRILPASEGGVDCGWVLFGYDPAAYGSGYGSYLAGGASQYYYGSSVSGAAYGAVLDGADQVYCGSSEGTVLLYEGGSLAGTVRGEGRRSTIDSVFGFLMLDDVTGGVTVSDGTAVHTAEATVLYKDGSGAFSFDNARLTTDSGVLFQMMDDDDDGRIGLLPGTYGCDPLYDERDTDPAVGFPGLTGGDAAPAEDFVILDEAVDPDALPPTALAPQTASVTYANGLYTGDIFNGTGYCGQPGDSLTVTVGKGALLNGDICLTSTRKAIPYSAEAVQVLDRYGDDVEYGFLDPSGAPCQEEEAAFIQLTRYTIGQYFLQGHVQNLPYYNGAASLDVTVAPGGAWAVRSVSTVTSLTVAEGALVYGQAVDNGDGSITLRPAPDPLEAGVYASGQGVFAPEETPAADAESSAAPADEDTEAAPEEAPAVDVESSAAPADEDTEPVPEEAPASPAPAETETPESVPAAARFGGMPLYTFGREAYVKASDLFQLLLSASRAPNI